jgi:flavin reductase (DIM6/NTAB) family NADH-FMN oxidoreductase RutF
MHSHPPIDPLLLRQVLGVFPTGVTVMTTCAEDGRFVGVTVNSFNSLSLNPPLILWSLSRRSGSLGPFLAAKHFAVNVLAQDQVAVSRRFASRAIDKFQDVEVEVGLDGIPLIAGCAAYIECRTWSSQAAGDHELFIGRVQRVQASGRPPLVFAAAGYFSVGGATE